MTGTGGYGDGPTDPEEQAHRLRDEAQGKADEYARDVRRTGEQARRSVPAAKPGLPKWLLPLVLALAVLALLWWLLGSCGTREPGPSPTPTAPTTNMPTPTPTT